MSRPEWFDGPSGRGDGSAPPQGGPGGGGGAGRPAATATRKRRGPLGPTLAVLAVLALVGGIAADVITDVWWYDSVGFRGVFVKEIAVKAVADYGVDTAPRLTVNKVTAPPTRSAGS